MLSCDFAPLFLYVHRKALFEMFGFFLKVFSLNHGLTPVHLVRQEREIYLRSDDQSVQDIVWILRFLPLHTLLELLVYKSNLHRDHQSQDKHHLHHQYFFP